LVDNTSMIKFAERIKEERISAGYTIKELADKLNISPRSVQYWEKGQIVPDIQMFMLISKLLDISMDYLTGNID